MIASFSKFSSGFLGFSKTKVAFNNGSGYLPSRLYANLLLPYKKKKLIYYLFPKILSVLKRKQIFIHLSVYRSLAATVIDNVAVIVLPSKLERVVAWKLSMEPVNS